MFSYAIDQCLFRQLRMKNYHRNIIREHIEKVLWKFSSRKPVPSHTKEIPRPFSFPFFCCRLETLHYSQFEFPNWGRNSLSPIVLGTVEFLRRKLSNHFCQLLTIEGRQWRTRMVHQRRRWSSQKTKVYKLVKQ